MSIIAYYVHVDDTQLQAVRERPAVVWNIKSNPRFATAALLDVDKDYEVVAWLVSGKKRREQAYQLATFRAISREESLKKDATKEEFDHLRSEELKKVGSPLGDTNEKVTDIALEAIEGRGTEAQRDPKINLGLGNARVFKPEEVKKLASLLSSISEADLRKSFSRKEMDKFDVGGMGWLDEPDSVFEKFLVPAFQKIRSFYLDAAKRGHYVLVIYQ
jgi:hypothetical protein